MWRATVETVELLGAYIRFCLRALRAVPHMDVHQLREQMRQVASGSVLVVAAVAAFAGAMITVQGYASLKALGTTDMLGMFVAMAGVREVFPLICSGCVGAKVGSAMAAELATLRLGQQLDALEVMAVDPFRHLVAPRMLAVFLMTPVLVGGGMLMGLAASYFTAVIQLGADPGAFVHRVVDSVAPRDIVAGMVKALAFGSLTGTLGCWHGWRSTGGAQAVGRAANLTVVQSMMVGAVVNLFISQGFYGGLG